MSLVTAARLQYRRPRLDSWVGKIHWRRDRLPTPVFLGFCGGSAGKESALNAGDLSSIPGLERSPGEGKGYPLQYSGLDPWSCKESDTTKRLSLSQSIGGGEEARTHWNSEKLPGLNAKSDLEMEAQRERCVKSH